MVCEFVVCVFRCLGFLLNCDWCGVGIIWFPVRGLWALGLGGLPRWACVIVGLMLSLQIIFYLGFGGDLGYWCGARFGGFGDDCGFLGVLLF